MIKNSIQWLAAFSFTVLLFSCSATKQVVDTGRIGNITKKTDLLYMEIDRVALESTQNNNVSGVAIAVIENGKVVWTQCIGFADIESKKPNTTETIFNVGSVSKMVSAWELMQLTEKGLVTLDEPVDQFLISWKLPPSEYDISKVTLRRILSHTAGLSVHGYGGSEQGIPLLSLEESLSGKTKRNGESVHLISQPGTKWEYSGGGYTLAQLLLEERTKEKFADYMKKNVFKPLGLNQTDYEWTEEMMKNSATAYDNSGKPIKNRIFTEKATAGLQTTIFGSGSFR